MDTLMDIAQLILFCLITYIAIIFVIRISGKRTLSKLNSFDFIVTVCLGSIMATTVVDSELPIYRGLLAFSALVFFQYVISFLTTHFEPVQKLVLFEPALLFYEGNFNESVMKKERISKREIYETIRQNGHEALDNVKAVVLETEGSLSIVPYSDIDGDHQTSLKNINK